MAGLFFVKWQDEDNNNEDWTILEKNTTLRSHIHVTWQGLDLSS